MSGLYVSAKLDVAPAGKTGRVLQEGTFHADRKPTFINWRTALIRGLYHGQIFFQILLVLLGEVPEQALPTDPC